LTPTDVDIVLSLQHPADIVPGYELLDLVGRGGMGVVYRAKQIDLDRIVALKTILISNVSDATSSARFQREAKALARLQHPNIVQALNFGKHEGRYYFAMEFVSGRTCEQAVRDQGLLPAAEVWMIVRQVASGLMHALRQNLIHRDIKPANLILVPPPEGTPWPGGEIVKITDFGLAMLADSRGDTMKLTTGDKIMGSPAYMSPEQFSGDTVDFRTDMYALGATAWHLLFGAPPFDGTNVARLFAQKLKPLDVDPAELPVVISDQQWRLLMGLLDADPKQRPPSYEALIDAIDALEINDPRVPAAQGVATDSDNISNQPTIELNAAGHRIEPEQSPGERSHATPTGWAPARVDPAASQHETVAYTIEPRSPRRTWVGWGGGAAILIAVIAVVIGSWLSPPRGPRIFTRVVESEPLFDGVTLSGWDVGGSMVGAWNTVEAPDSSTAIACTADRGALTRRLPELENPRISLFVWLQRDGGPVDIDFALDSAKLSERRGCLRLSQSTIQLGFKTGDFGDLDAVAKVSAPVTILDRYHVVYLERQLDDWYVFVEEQLIGTLPIERSGDGNAVRVVVHGSERRDVAPPHAYIADVQIDDLRPAD
jgi:serine/threonine protein kinase